MSLVGALNVGQTALAVSQASIQVTGNNIANSGNSDYSREVAGVTAKWGGVLETVPFTGHVTLARVRGQGKGPANLAGTPIRAAWRVDEVVLVSSTLGAGGALYETLESVPLA